MRGSSVVVIAGLALCFFARPAASQEHQHAKTGDATWTIDGNAFLGRNYQRRLFADYSTWESQNWFMLAGDRPSGRGRLHVNGMVSLEAVTMHDRGSPQLFQTGESYERTPLVNFQYPHDLLMELGATYAFTRRRGDIYCRRRSRWVADARTHGVHASRVRSGQPAGSLDSPLP